MWGRPTPPPADPLCPRAVLLYCWHSFHNRVGPGIWFTAMNFAVHAVMYSYYFISIIGYRAVAKPLAPLITTAQIVQMVGGTLVTVTAARTHSEVRHAPFFFRPRPGPALTGRRRPGP